MKDCERCEEGSQGYYSKTTATEIGVEAVERLSAKRITIRGYRRERPS
jgi:hypothetical protein